MNSIEIKVKKEHSGIEYIINLSECVHEYQLREGIRNALILGGYVEEYARKILNEGIDKTEPSND